VIFAALDDERLFQFVAESSRSQTAGSSTDAISLKEVFVTRPRQ
jgi:hypothetical protein